MKRILFLDDDPNRHRVFDRMMIGLAVVDHVHTVSELRNALTTNEPYDLVSLDHDLDLNGRRPGCEETGTDAAEFIRLHLPREKYPEQILIHSWNPDGACRMECLIREVGIPVSSKPFSC